MSRYLLLTYYKKANGQIDETLAITKTLKLSDVQTASVILDFKKLKVEKANLDGASVPKDWDRIVSYYNQFYEATIERLFYENGWQVIKEETTEETSDE